MIINAFEQLIGFLLNNKIVLTIFEKIVGLDILLEVSDVESAGNGASVYLNLVV